jgi:hypothetical protein
MSWFIDYCIANEYRYMSYENLVNNYGKEAVDARLTSWLNLSVTLLHNFTLVKKHDNAKK